MGLVKTANPIVDIRGSVGGSVFSRDASGLHIATPKRTVHKRSPLQDRRRRAFRSAANAWVNVTTYQQKTLWVYYARRHPDKNRIGESTILSGYQVFMRFNIYRAYNNVSLILLPPEG